MIETSLNGHFCGDPVHDDVTNVAEKRTFSFQSVFSCGLEFFKTCFMLNWYHDWSKVITQQKHTLWK